MWELVDEAASTLSRVSTLTAAADRIDGYERDEVVEQIDEELHSAEVSLTRAVVQLYETLVTSLEPAGITSEERRHNAITVLSVLDSALVEL